MSNQEAEYGTNKRFFDRLGRLSGQPKILTQGCPGNTEHKLAGNAPHQANGNPFGERVMEQTRVRQHGK